MSSEKFLRGAYEAYQAYAAYGGLWDRPDRAPARVLATL